MATPQTLDHFLDGSPDSVQHALIEAFSAIVPNPGTVTYPPVAISLYWGNRGEGSMRQLHGKEGPIVCATPIRTSIDNLVAEIRRRLGERVGDNPIGTIRVRCYVKGQSESPLFDKSATIIPADTFGLADPSMSLLISELAETRKQRDTAINGVIAMSGHLSAIVQSQAQQIAQLSVARTAGTAGSELGSIGAVAGVVMLILGYPALKSALGVSPDGTMIELVTAARKLMLSAVGGSAAGATYAADGREQVQLRRLAPPGVERPGELVDGDPVDGAAGVVDAAEVDAAEVDAIAALLARADEDPAFREQLLSRAFANAGIRAGAMAAYMAGGG
jgi:hypothetical protein